MEPAEYSKLEALERDYWWHQGRSAMVLGLLDQLKLPSNDATGRPRIGDIGCGTGMLLKQLQERGTAVGLDYSPLALGLCREKGLQRLLRADACHIPLESDCLDGIVSLDVVEHIKDDIGIISEFFRTLRPGGAALMSVPAHPELWSSHDLALHHYRRYTKPQFKALIENRGFQLERLTYGMFTPLLPALAWRYGLKAFRRPVPGPPGPNECVRQRAEGYQTDEKRVPKPINSLLRGLLRTEAYLLRRTNLPAGLTLIAIARKPPK